MERENQVNLHYVRGGNFKHCRIGAKSAVEHVSEFYRMAVHVNITAAKTYVFPKCGTSRSPAPYVTAYYNVGIISMLIEHPAGNSFFSVEVIGISTDSKLKLVNGLPKRITCRKITISLIYSKIAAELSIFHFAVTVKTYTVHASGGCYFGGFTVLIFLVVSLK